MLVLFWQFKDDSDDYTGDIFLRITKGFNGDNEYQISFHMSVVNV